MSSDPGSNPAHTTSTPEYAQPQQIPYQMIPPTVPSFLTNPFINPYMTAQPNDGTWPAAPITAAQYQEMMQQYFQQMMAASGAQFQIPFPTMPFPQQQFQNVQQRPSSQCSGKSDGRTTSLTPDMKQPSTTPALEDEKQSASTSGVSSCERESSTPADPTSEDVEHCFSLLDDVKNEEDVPSGLIPTETSSRKASNDSGTSKEVDRTDSLIRKQMNEIEKEISRRSQNKNIKKINDGELAELMGTVPVNTVPQQPIDPFSPDFATFSNESALPYTPPAEEKQPVVKETLNQLRDSFNLNGNDTDLQKTEEVQPTNAQTSFPVIPQPPIQFSTPPFQAPNQFNGGGSPFSAQAIQYHMQQQQQHIDNANMAHNFLQQQQQQPQVQAVPQPSQNTITPEQLASVFASHQITPQQQQLLADLISQASPAPATPSPTPATTSSTHAPPLAPPPAPAHPVPRQQPQQQQQTSNGGWPEENKENGQSTSAEEPVWVLRDSYLKRMQREQPSASDEMSWQEAATAAQERAENQNDDDEEHETDRLLVGTNTVGSERRSSVDKKKNSKETMVHEPAVLIEGVLFRARYLGSTQMLCESRGTKAARMAQAQEAVARVKAPEGEIQPSTEIDLFISTEKIMVLNTDLQRISDTDVRQDILMDHALRTISYIADIGDVVVLMARRMSTSNSDDSCSQDSEGVRKSPKVICHVFESEEASFIAQSIGQAFQVAYVEFLRANGIDDPSYLRQIDYQEVLNSQELLGDELEMFAKKETQKEVVVPKKTGEPLGVAVVESGWGSMLPTVVLAHMNPIGPAAHSNKLNIGDQIININGISLVGLPLTAAQTQIKNCKSATVVRLTVVSTPPVVEVRIKRPDTKYQLGFSVQNGVICSLLRGGIAERGGIRVGHRIIEINGTSVVAVAHDRIVHMLATAVGEIHMKTMPTSMFRLLTGQETPQYI